MTAAPAEVRKLEASEWPEAEELIRQTVFADRADMSAEQIDKQLRRQAGIILLGAYDEHSRMLGIGIVTIKKHTGRLMVCGLGVREGYRRQGVGRALTVAIEKLAVESEMPSVLANLGLGMNGFFERQGYSKTASGMYKQINPDSVQADNSTSGVVAKA